MSLCSIEEERTSQPLYLIQGSEIDDVKEEYGEHVTVQYTGPWPPYNFVDIHIGAEQQHGGR